MAIFGILLSPSYFRLVYAAVTAVRSELYVDAVVSYAAQLRRDEDVFFAYYAWQVFIKTPSGPRRITDP